MSSESVVSVRSVSKKYSIVHQSSKETLLGKALARKLRDRWRGNSPEEFWALQDVSFEVAQGEVVGLIGRNGAGKSTLLKILSRITEMTSGEVVLRGRAGSLLEVGTGFHQDLTGRENVYLNGTILGMTKAEIRHHFDAIVEFAQVERFLDTPVKRYSSGMYVRLAFSVAAHLRSEILIVDEVLAVGDTEFQRRCLGKMKEAASSGRTVLFVSHDMTAMEALTNRCVWLRQGSVAATGPTNEVIAEYIRSVTSGQSADVSTKRRMKPTHGVEIRLESITPFYGPRVSFPYGKELVFDVGISSAIDYGSLRFGVTIHEAGGHPILTCFSPQKIRLEAGRSSVYRLRLFDVPLAPGAYELSLSIGEGTSQTTRRDHDLVKNAVDFEIGSRAEDGSGLFGWHRAYGPFVHDATDVELVESGVSEERASA